MTGAIAVSGGGAARPGGVDASGAAASRGRAGKGDGGGVRYEPPAVPMPEVPLSARQHRSAVEHLAALRPRLEVLRPDDRSLVEMIATGTCSRREAARLMGIAPMRVCRRFLNLWRRLHHPLVGMAFDPRCPWAPELRQLAVEYHLLAMTLDELADRHRMPYARVRTLLRSLEFATAPTTRGVSQRGE